MKRVKAACILQTLVFSQKPELNFTRERALKLNTQEFDHYIAALDRAQTRYVIADKQETENGSIVVHIKKQYNDKADISEYFS